MALRRVFTLCGKHSRAFSTTPVLSGGSGNQPVKWNFDWYPGPYPEEMTEKQKRKIAEKYNLEPEDYEPVDPEIGIISGDMPELPVHGFCTKSHFVDWDFPDSKRDFNEPIRHDYDLFQRYDPAYEYRTNLSHAASVAIIVGVTGTLYTLHWLTKDMPFQAPMKPKQFCYNYFDLSLENNEQLKRNYHGHWDVEAPHH